MDVLSIVDEWPSLLPTGNATNARALSSLVYKPLLREPETEEPSSVGEHQNAANRQM